jgi:hypothetical protein
VSNDPEEIGVRHFRIFGDKKLTTGGVAKSQNATVPQSWHSSGGQVSLHAIIGSGDHRRQNKGQVSEDQAWTRVNAKWH